MSSRAIEATGRNWAMFVKLMDDTDEVISRAREMGFRYQARSRSLRGYTEGAYAYLVVQDEPPYRGDFPGEDHPTWVEWHRVRGIDPYAYKPRHRLPRRIREAVIARDGLTCGLCGSDVEADDVHVDHIHPRLHGGTDDLDNLQVAHSFCNISKGAKTAA